MSRSASSRWRVPSLALLTAALVLMTAARPKTDTVFLRYTLLCEVPPSVAEAILEGDTLIEARGKEQAGEILSLSVSPALVENERGVFKDEARCRLLLTLGASAKARGGYYYLGTTPVIPGCRLYLHGRAMLEGVCLSVEAAVPWQA